MSLKVSDKALGLVVIRLDVLDVFQLQLSFVTVYCHHDWSAVQV